MYLGRRVLTLRDPDHPHRRQQLLVVLKVIDEVQADDLGLAVLLG